MEEIGLPSQRIRKNTGARKPTKVLHLIHGRPSPAANTEGLREAIEALFESAKEMHECAMRNDVGGLEGLEYDKWRVQAERRYWDATNQARAALRGEGEKK